MICPQCNKEVSAKFLWILSGANGSSCPHCQANLCPKASCAVVLFLVSCLLGDGALLLFRWLGAEPWLAFAAFFVVFAAAYLVGMRVILRLRVNAPAGFVAHGDPGAQGH
jgi:hypothetical protein